MAPIISIVIPVHNGANYIERCLQSVLDQTYSHWRCLVLDNCSTDATLRVARESAAGDPRIEIKEAKEFVGLFENFNRVMRRVTPDADYVKPLFADDWLFPRCLEEMVRVGEANPTAGLISSYRLEEDRVTCDGLEPERELFDGRDVCRRSLIDGLFVFGSSSTVMLRGDRARERNPFYALGRLHPDTESCYELLGENDLGFVHQVLSFTRRQDGSLTAGLRAIDSAHRLDRLITVARYGPRFLSEDEHRTLLVQVEDDYYRFLGERTLYATGRRFWEYHHAGLASISRSLDGVRLRRAQLRALSEQIRENPMEFGRRLVRVSRRKLAEASAT